MKRTPFFEAGAGDKLAKGWFDLFFLFLHGHLVLQVNDVRGHRHIVEMFIHAWMLTVSLVKFMYVCTNRLLHQEFTATVEANRLNSEIYLRS